MALDGLVVRSIAHELNTKLVGGKIDRVHQPENDEILLYVRNNRENFKVVLSSSSSNPRVYIANKYNKENPLKAPMFCMLLRKHLQGGIITDITQVGFERIIKISIESYDELKDKSTKNIYVEIMGRHSNIILTHDKDSTIIDSIKRVPPSVSRARQILPAMTYELPPAQDKIDPVKGCSLKSFINTLREFDGSVFKGIYSKFLGISPTVAKEICYRAEIDFNVKAEDLSRDDLSQLYRTFSDIFTKVKNNEFSPCIVVNEKVDKVVDFNCIDLTFYEGFKFIHDESISKIVALMLAILDNGEEYVFSKVGMEPTGDPFNSITKLETSREKKPYNPLINAGAIAVSSMIKGKDARDKFERLLDFFKKISEDETLDVNYKIYCGESETENRNRAMGYFLKGEGIIEGNVEDALDIYFKQCSIEVTAKTLAKIGLFLANNGKLSTGETVITPKIATIVKTLMVTCGMYDSSGEFAVRAGIPSKSGVGGGILSVVPGKMGIGVYGPSLDKKGNSIAGVALLEDLSTELNLTIF